MAKDLGNLNIEIDVNKQSINDAFEDGGKSAGSGITASIKNLLSKFSAPAGGGGGGMGLELPRGRAGGLNLGTAGSIKSIITKVAAVIGVVALLGAALGKVVKTIMSWGRELEATTIKLSKVNAALAMQAAAMQVGQLMRDIKSADVLAPFLLESTNQMEDVKNQLRPILDLVSIIKSIIVTEAMIKFKELLKLVAKIAEVVAHILTAVNYLRDIEKVAKSATATPSFMPFGGMAPGTPLGVGLKFMGNMAYGAGLAFGTTDTPADAMKALIKNWKGERAEQHDALMQIVAELRNLNDTGEAEHINKYMGQVGIALTEGKWNPFPKHLGGGSP